MRLHVRDQGSGPAIVLLHGFPLDGRMWDAQANALATAGFRVLVPDLRGLGRSPVAASATMDEMAADVLKTLDHAGVERFAVAGFSMGGYVALALAEQASERVTGVALVDSRTAADTDAQRAARDATIAAVQEGGLGDLADGMLPKLLLPGAEARSRVQAWMMEQAPRGVAAALAGMRDRPDRTRTWQGLAVPRLVVVGREDAITPPDEARALGAETFLEVHAAHLSPVEDPDAVSEALKAWLGRVAREN